MDKTELRDRKSGLMRRIKKLITQIDRQTDLMDELYRDMRNGDIQASKTGGPLAREMVTTTRQLIDAESDLEKLIQQEDGDAGSGVIDFAEARGEIRSLLDRLRAARGSGEISE